MTRLSPETTVTAIAADLPGAAELFRRKGINFCCGGNIALSEAATRAGVLPDALLAELHALADAAGRDAPEPTPALIDHILSRYHETHRAELKTGGLTLREEDIEEPWAGGTARKDRNYR